ncbi:hypothetical protein [Pseudonocardia sp. GCM10023141]|uniref:hypothetical protein n=1 Tax=Pseudonocardia sp. GCM10023141 TaxID=3252653 RepID=UPI00361215A3
MTAELLGLQVPTTPWIEVEHLRRAANAAVAQPGDRPWRLWPVDRGVELRAESVRSLPSSPAGAAAVRVAAGAALLNMRLTVAAMGDRPVTTLLPDPARPRVLAVVRRGKRSDPTPAERELADTIGRAARRCPEIGLRPVPDGIRNLVRRAAEAEGVWLRSVVDAGDREQLIGAVPSVGGRRCSGLVAVIGSNYDVPAMQLRVGQGVQRVVLTAVALGFAARVVAWPPDLRAALGLPGSVGGPGLCPQAILEVGWPLTRRARLLEG